MSSRITVVFLIISSLLGSTFAATTITWDGSTSRAWNVTSNWDLSRLPTSSDTAIVALANGPIIDSGVAAAVNTIQIGGASGGTVDINGGTLTTSGSSTASRIDVGYTAGTNGTLTVNSGTVNCAARVYVGESGTGTLIMNGGTLNITGNRFRIGFNNTGVGSVYLNGGTINCNNSSTNFSMANSGTASMDITNGRLIINGNLKSMVDGYVTSGLITAYGGDGTVLVDYGVTNPSKTTVMAVMPPEARFPVPANNAADVPSNSDLSWTAGAGAVSHNVYFGTANPPAAFQGNQTATTFDPGQLAPGTTYFWRIDEVDGSSTVTTGYVWTFTTASGLAKNPSPGNSAANLTINPTLSWRSGAGAASHDIYFGAVLADVNSAARLLGDINGDRIVNWQDLSLLSEYWLADPANSEPYAACDDDSIVDFGDYALLSQNWRQSADSIFKGNQDSNSFDPGTLAFSTTYYWRVDEVNGPDTYRGTVWSFTTQSGKASNPSPANGASNISLTPTLSWTAGPASVSHNVYFDTTNPPAYIGNQSSITYIPDTLVNSTTYYWRVDEVGSSDTIQGDLWSFTTAAVVDPNESLIGKVMVGYQGWHNAPGDGTTLGWKHWSDSTSSFDASTCHVAMWPDMNDYTPAEKFLTGFTGGYYVYSSHNLATVRRHFQWMQQAGIDGAYMQRFATEVTSETSQIGMHRNAVLDYCKDGANLYGRKYAVMYDLTSASVSTLPINDWKYLVDTKKVTRDPNDHAYMRHNGKPVVAVWGIGFGRSYDSGVPAFLDLLKNDPVYGGNVIMIGVNDNWRSNTGDTYLQQCLNLADIISPWMVGRYAMLSPTDYAGVDGWCNNNWIPDLAWCTSHNKEYLLVVFPGYSYSIADGAKPLNEMPRWGGNFLWRQFYKSIGAGVQMLYIAMFDEVDEGTALYKVSNNPPTDLPFIVYREDLVGQGRNYVPAGAALPGDHYMWLTGQGGRMLRGEIPLSSTKPSR